MTAYPSVRYYFMQVRFAGRSYRALLSRFSPDGNGKPR